MKGRTHTAVLRAGVAILFAGAFFSRCANIMTPEGGPRDTIPPVIVKLQPDNFTTGFKSDKIYIEFNEFVQIKDQSKEFFTSPAMKKLPLLSTRGKGIVVTIRDTLQENITYALDFGSAIRDNNEGNPLNAMRYVFSTGDEVDSLMCSGYTADSYTADSVSRTFIWFFLADSLPDTPGYDSTMFNRKPDVIARAQNNGIFIAQNLKPVDYRIYAFGDKNDNMMYEAGTDMVGFLDTVYNPARMPDFAIWFDSLRMYPTAEPQLYFRMFTDRAFRNQRLVEAQRPMQKKALLYFNAALPDVESIRFDSIPDDKVLYDPQTRGKDTVALWFDVPAENLPDTIKGEITYFRHDSTRQYVKTTEPLKLAWRLIESKEEEREREREEKEREKAEREGREYEAPPKPNPFKYTLSARDEFNPEQGLSIKLDFPAVKFDSAAVSLVKLGGTAEAGSAGKGANKGGEASGERTPVARRFIRDTLDMGRWRVEAAWEDATMYELFIPPGAITDVMGYSNDSIKVALTTFDPEKFATITIDVAGEAGKRYIIQQTDASGKTQQEVKGVATGKYTIRFVPAGEIRLRIIEDTNGNGEWDSGNVVEHLQPERAEMYINERGEDLFATKMNWEISLAMDMSKIFAPVTMQNLIKMLDDKENSRLKKLYEEMMKRQAQGKDNDSHSHGSGGMTGGMGGMFGSGGMQQMTGGLGGMR